MCSKKIFLLDLQQFDSSYYDGETPPGRSQDEVAKNSSVPVVSKSAVPQEDSTLGISEFPSNLESPIVNTPIRPRVEERRNRMKKRISRSAFDLAITASQEQAAAAARAKDTSVASDLSLPSTIESPVINRPVKRPKKRDSGSDFKAILGAAESAKKNVKASKKTSSKTAAAASVQPIKEVTEEQMPSTSSRDPQPSVHESVSTDYASTSKETVEKRVSSVVSKNIRESEEPKRVRKSTAADTVHPVVETVNEQSSSVVAGKTPVVIEKQEKPARKSAAAGSVPPVTESVQKRVSSALAKSSAVDKKIEVSLGNLQHSSSVPVEEAAGSDEPKRSTAVDRGSILQPEKTPKGNISALPVKATPEQLRQSGRRSTFSRPMSALAVEESVADQSHSERTTISEVAVIPETQKSPDVIPETQKSTTSNAVADSFDSSFPSRLESPEMDLRIRRPGPKSKKRDSDFQRAFDKRVLEGFRSDSAEEDVAREKNAAKSQSITNITSVKTDETFQSEEFESPGPSVSQRRPEPERTIIDSVSQSTAAARAADAGSVSFQEISRRPSSESVATIETPADVSTEDLSPIMTSTQLPTVPRPPVSEASIHIYESASIHVDESGKFGTTASPNIDISDVPSRLHEKTVQITALDETDSSLDSEIPSQLESLVEEKRPNLPQKKKAFEAEFLAVFNKVDKVKPKEPTIEDAHSTNQAPSDSAAISEDLPSYGKVFFCHILSSLLISLVFFL